MEPIAPIAIYNSDKKELIAVFRNMSVLIRYLSNKAGIPEYTEQRVRDSIKRRGSVNPSTTVLNLKLAFRFANTAQLEMLGDAPYILCVDYIPQVPNNFLKGFKETATSFRKMVNDKQGIKKAVA